MHLVPIEVKRLRPLVHNHNKEVREARFLPSLFVLYGVLVLNKASEKQAMLLNIEK